MSENDKVVVEGRRTNTRGAQVILTGEAQEAARGGLAPTQEGNTIAKRALEADGTVPDGYGVVGTTEDHEAADVVVTEGGKPGGTVPAKEGSTRVEVKEPPAVANAPAPTSPAAPQKPAPQGQG